MSCHHMFGQVLAPLCFALDVLITPMFCNSFGSRSQSFSTPLFRHPCVRQPYDLTHRNATTRMLTHPKVSTLPCFGNLMVWHSLLQTPLCSNTTMFQHLYVSPSLCFNILPRIKILTPRSSDSPYVPKALCSDTITCLISPDNHHQDNYHLSAWWDRTNDNAITRLTWFYLIMLVIFFKTKAAFR